jgi:hypothetical protein
MRCSEEQEKFLWDLMRYADHHKSFNRKFVDDIYDFWDKHEYITIDQLYTLQKIYRENNVSEFIERLYPYRE